LGQGRQDAGGTEIKQERVMKKHKIGWLNRPGTMGESWNPVVGCSKVTAGCVNCYAERMAWRLATMNVLGYRGVVDRLTPAYSPRWKGKTVLVESALEKPLRWKKPRTVFVCSMGDLFHENTPDEWIDCVFAVMALCPQHTFIVLTKRAERMAEYFDNEQTVVRVLMAKLDAAMENMLTMPLVLDLPLPNVWLGVTAENQEQADRRIQHLLRTPCAVRFVSCEPMLGPVDLSGYMAGGLTPGGFLDGLSWVICGCEAGPGRRPMNHCWADDLLDECIVAGVPFYMKQLQCDNGRVVKELDEFPPTLRVREFPVMAQN